MWGLFRVCGLGISSLGGFSILWCWKFQGFLNYRSCRSYSLGLLGASGVCRLGLHAEQRIKGYGGV